MYIYIVYLLSNKIFLLQPVIKILRQLYKIQYIKIKIFSQKTLRTPLTPIKNPLPLPYFLNCGLVICSLHGIGINCRLMNID